MKKISLGYPEKTGGFYLVKLGNKKQIQFTNVLECHSFINDTNKFLTENLNHLNLLFATVINEYREHWFYFDTNRTTGRAEKIQNNKLVLERVKETFDLFESLVFQSTTLNGYFLVWRNFEKIIKNLLFVVEVLKEMDVEKSYFSQVVRLNIIEKYVNEINESLINYSQFKF